jgi:hypothetical protein
MRLSIVFALVVLVFSLGRAFDWPVLHCRSPSTRIPGSFTRSSLKPWSSGVAAQVGNGSAPSSATSASGSATTGSASGSGGGTSPSAAPIRYSCAAHRTLQRTLPPPLLRVVHLRARHLLARVVVRCRALSLSAVAVPMRVSTSAGGTVPKEKRGETIFWVLAVGLVGLCLFGVTGLVVSVMRSSASSVE